ncbi:hypothetical protein [Blautia sp.]
MLEFSDIPNPESLQQKCKAGKWILKKRLCRVEPKDRTGTFLQKENM